MEMDMHFLDDVGARGSHEEVPFVLILGKFAFTWWDERVAVADVDCDCLYAS
jgi:hypothetical protein